MLAAKWTAYSQRGGLRIYAGGRIVVARNRHDCKRGERSLNFTFWSPTCGSVCARRYERLRPTAVFPGLLVQKPLLGTCYPTNQLRSTVHSYGAPGFITRYLIVTCSVQCDQS